MQQIEKNTIHDIFAGYFEDPLLKKIAFWVSKKLEEGNICLDLKAPELVDNEKINVEYLQNNPYISTDARKNLQPFILANNKIYLQRYFYYETIIIEKIYTLILNSNIDRNKNLLIENAGFVKNLLDNNDLDNNQISWQMVAIISAVINNFTIITGGPGTGKTTTIAKFLSIVFKMFPDISIALAAPTGKAAARMNQSILNTIESIQDLDSEIIEKLNRLQTKTIHRLLGPIPNSPEFKHNSEIPLHHDIIIIDETSMVDAALLAKLMDAVKDDAKLIFLGDKNQLASVEAGSIFGDICSLHEGDNFINKETSDVILELFKEKTSPSIKLIKGLTGNKNNLLEGHIIELKHSYRFDENQGIGKLSKLVIGGVTAKEQILDPFRHHNNQEEYAIITTNYIDGRFTEMLKHYEEYAKEDDIKTAFEKLNNIITLCAVREGEYGFKEYNTIIENHLKKKGLINPDDIFYDRQPVMITVNNYNLGVFNGDIGIIRVDEKGEKRIYFVDDESSIKHFPVFEINWFETAYAMTIHKSQGSEYENVIIILPEDKTNQVLSRELLYTAITRARKKVIIYSKDDVLLETVKRKINRISGIKERLLTR